MNNISVPWALQSDRICTTQCSEKAEDGITACNCSPDVTLKQLLFLRRPWKGMMVDLCSHLWLSTKDSAASVVLMLGHKMAKFFFLFSTLGWAGQQLSMGCVLSHPWCGWEQQLCFTWSSVWGGPESPQRPLHWLRTTWLPPPALLPLTVVTMAEGRICSYLFTFLPKAKNAKRGQEYN